MKYGNGNGNGDGKESGNGDEVGLWIQGIKVSSEEGVYWNFRRGCSTGLNQRSEDMIYLESEK